MNLKCLEQWSKHFHSEYINGQVFYLSMFITLRAIGDANEMLHSEVVYTPY